MSVPHDSLVLKIATAIAQAVEENNMATARSLAQAMGYAFIETERTDELPPIEACVALVSAKAKWPLALELAEIVRTCAAEQLSKEKLNES